MSKPIGCQSHLCAIAPPNGMGHNGPCRCVDWRGLRELQRLRAALDREREALALAREIVERLSNEEESEFGTVLMLDTELSALRRALGRKE